jgi:hypothetical protein
MNVTGKLVESDKSDLEPYWEWPDSLNVYGYDIRYQFSDQELPGGATRNEGMYKDFEFHFFFSVDINSKTIDIVFNFTDGNIASVIMRNNEDKEFITALFDGIEDHIEAKLRAESVSILEEEVRTAALEFQANKLGVRTVETAGEFVSSVTYDDISTFSATTLKDSEMFLFKFENFDPEGNEPFQDFKSFLEKTAELQEQKECQSDRTVFTEGQIDNYISKANLILALVTNIEKNGHRFWEMNGYVFCKMPSNPPALPSEILLLQSFVPDALTQTQYHEVDGSNLFGTMLVSLAENIMHERGARKIILDAIPAAEKFYTRKMGYSAVPDERRSNSIYIALQKEFPTTRGRFFNQINPPDVWKEILLQRKNTKRNIEAALRLVRGNTVAAAQLMHFYLKRKMT